MIKRGNTRFPVLPTFHIRQSTGISTLIRIVSDVEIPISKSTQFAFSPEKPVTTALVMTADSLLSDQFFRAFHEVDVKVITTGRVRESIELIHGRKFEAFVLDTAIDTPFLDLLSEVRSSPSNSTSVVVAVAPPGPLWEKARKAGANFMLEQPPTADAIGRTLRASYGMIVRESRRYFRHCVKLPIMIWSSVTGEIEGQTVNISEEGMAVRLPYSLAVDTELLIRFKLPTFNKEVVSRAKIARTAANGLVGVRFTEMPKEAKGQLHEWLSRRLEEQVPSLVKHSA